MGTDSLGKVMLAGLGVVGIVIAGFLMWPGAHYRGIMPPSQAVVGTGGAPASQVSFHSALHDLAQTYKVAKPNSDNSIMERDRAKEVQRDMVRKVQQMGRNLPTTGVTGWVATVDEVLGNESGAGLYLEMILAGIRVRYHATSDALWILKTSPLYSTVAGLRKGDTVVFSGEVGEETSFTDSGAVQHPEFAVRFTSIRRRN